MLEALVPITALAALAPSPTPPIYAEFSFAYPYWYHPVIGGPQDAVTFGDEIQTSGLVRSDAEIASITIEAHELGIPEPIEYPPLYNEREQLYPFQAVLKVGTRANGSAKIRATVIDVLGNKNIQVITLKLDNTPPSVQITNTRYATSSGPLGTLLVSGELDPAETKLYAFDYRYILYDADQNEIDSGSFEQRSDGGQVFTDLPKGTFTDYPVRLGVYPLDRRPEAVYVATRLTMRDGAGNDTTTTGPKTALAGTSTPNLPDIPPGSAVSSVLFLPGLEGSRLYKAVEGCSPSQSTCVEEKLWDPNGTSDIRDLYLNPSGTSIHTDVYTKVGDTINNVSLFKFYESFARDMDSFRGVGSMTEWRAVAYDWRLSLRDIVSKGAKHDSRIYYTEATSTPYIEQTLNELASRSRTGKVTIVAHSNGGLVAKALLQKIGDGDTARLVDNVILIGTPQSGAPQSIAGLLHGYGTALPADWCSTWAVVGALCSKNVSRTRARALAENMPGAYHLLPSLSYFDSVRDILHPLIAFTSNNAYRAERSAYGRTIDSENELFRFLTAQEGGRSKPIPSELSTPNVLNAGLLAYTHDVHAALDAWVPPSTVKMYQIGGWGVDTLSGIEYYDRKKPGGGPGETIAAYRPAFVEDGDATVPIPSSLLMPLASNIKRYWLDLSSSALLASLAGIRHANLLESSDVRIFIGNILVGTPDRLPRSITTTQPATSNPKKKLLFLLRGPATLHAYDRNGRHTGQNTESSIEETIPGSTYGEIGETKYILAKADETYQIVARGLDAGIASLEIQEQSEDNNASSTYETPVALNTESHLVIENGIDGTIGFKNTEEESTATPTHEEAGMSQNHSSSHSRSSKILPSDIPEQEIIVAPEPITIELTPEQDPTMPEQYTEATSTETFATTSTELARSNKNKKSMMAAALVPVQDLMHTILAAVLKLLATVLALISTIWKH
ncbi:MAG: lecithin-cholesterol acyltransferase [Parcubacteria bacterium C7867-007]|nr:MAG: lecithin-cholesterol acyltransferase [Parcubacteria bacterium C7867-007]